MQMFNVPQALLWIANYQVRKFNADDLKALLAFLAKPANCSLFVVNEMFLPGKGIWQPGASTRNDIPESLRGAVADPPASIFQNAHDDMLQKLRDGKLAMYGRKVPRQAGTVLLENGALAVIGYPPGREPITQLEIIPCASFAELTFVDLDGDSVVAVPSDFPSREFPRYRDLLADDVPRLWPIKTPITGKKRGRTPDQFNRVVAAMRASRREWLDTAKEEELKAQFNASRDTCRRARKEIESEN